MNAAILIVAAAVFHRSGHFEVAAIEDAYKLLSPLVGAGFASTLFAVALLASGQNSSITGTLAGQVVMEGFIQMKVSPWMRRLITRSIAIVPTIMVVAVNGEQGTEKLLILSQVILVAAVELCGGAACGVYGQPQAHGRVCKWPRAASAGLDDGCGDRGPECMAANPDGTRALSRIPHNLPTSGALQP